MFLQLLLDSESADPGTWGLVSLGTSCPRPGLVATISRSAEPGCALDLVQVSQQAGRDVRDPVGARPLQLLAPIAAQPQRRARHAASRSHTEWPTTTVSVMSTSSRSAAARNRSGSGLAWPPGPALPPARRRVGTWSTSRVGYAASGSPLVAPPTAPAGCSGAAAAGGRRAVAAPSRRGAHRPRHGLAGAGRPGRRRPAPVSCSNAPTTDHRFIPMRRWIRHADSSIPPASNASCQASARQSRTAY